MEPEFFNSSQLSNSEKTNFIDDFIGLFPHENEELITLLAYELLNSGNFSGFMNSFSLFITINELINHYLNTGELVKLKHFNMCDNPVLVNTAYENFNNVHIVVNDYTYELLELVFIDVPFTRKKVSYSANSAQLTLLNSFSSLGLGNNTCVDFINVILTNNMRYSDSLTDFLTLYSHDSRILNIGEKLDNYNFSNIALNRLTNSRHKDYMSAPMLRTMQECLVEIRNLLIGQEEKSKPISFIIDKILTMRVPDDVKCSDVKKLFLIYSHVLLLTHYDKSKYSIMGRLFYDVNMFSNDMLENDIDTITNMIHFFIESNGNVPFYLIKNVII